MFNLQQLKYKLLKHVRDLSRWRILRRISDSYGGEKVECLEKTHLAILVTTNHLSMLTSGINPRPQW